MKRSSSFTVSRRSVLAASTVGALGAALVAVPLLAVSASASENEHDGDGHKVTICHRNNNDKKPYVRESVDIASSGLLKAGHSDHTGDVWAAGMKSDHDRWGDIIPAYTYRISEHRTFSFPGLNWDAEGKAIYNAGCRVVLPTPTETTPSTEPTDEPTTPEETATEEPGSPEPTATETSPEPTATETSPEPTATETSPEPTATETSPEPTSTEQPGSPEPTATETSPEPTATETSPEPTSTEQPGSPEPTATETSPEPTATETSPEPTATETTPQSGPTPEQSGSGNPGDNSSEDPGLPSTGGNGATLPKTGSDSGALLALAAGLVTVGAASIVVARRRTETETD